MLAPLILALTAIVANAQKTTLNLGFILPYELNEKSIALNVQANDAAAELAVNDLAPGLLQNTDVKINRINSWNPASKFSYLKTDGGGYSTIAAIKAVNETKIVAAFGGYFSNSTSFLAEQLSLYNVPFCGSTQTDPTLDSRTQYPFFMRTLPGYMPGAHVVQVLQKWATTRIVVISGYDTISNTYANDIAQTVAAVSEAAANEASPAESISITSMLVITQTMQESGDYSYIYESIMSLYAEPSTTTRYFVLAADPKLTAEFYFFARDKGLVGDYFVWLSLNPPAIDGTNFATGFSNAKNDLQGFFWLKPDQTSASTSLTGPAEEFAARWMTLNKENPNKYPLDDGKLPLHAMGSYDCISLLLNGFSSFWPQNASTQIATRDYLGNCMSHSNSESQDPCLTQFAMTGAKGLTVDTLSIEPWTGNLLVPMLLVSLNSEILSKDIHSVGRASACASTNVYGSMINNHFDCLFYDGSAIPPNDGSAIIEPTERVIATDSPLSKVFTALQAIGIITSGLALGVYVAELVVRKKSVLNPIYLILIVIGSILVYVSIPLYTGAETANSCSVQRWILPIGFGIINSCIIARMFHLSKSLGNQTERKAGVAYWMLLAAVVPPLVLNLIFAGVWVRAGATQTFVPVGLFEFILECSTTDQLLGEIMTYCLYGVDGLLGLIVAIMANRLRREPEVKLTYVLALGAMMGGLISIFIQFLTPNTVLPRIIRAFFTFAMSMAYILVTIAPSVYALLKGDGPEAMDDDHLIKSGINRESTFTHDVSQLEVLSLGTVFYQQRGLLGWSKPCRADMILHRRRGHNTLTFAEVHTYLVKSFNISSAESGGGQLSTTGAGSNNGMSENDSTVNSGFSKEKNDLSELEAVDDAESDREIKVSTKAFSLRVTTMTANQATEIKKLLFSKSAAAGGSNLAATAGTTSSSAHNGFSTGPASNLSKSNKSG